MSTVEQPTLPPEGVYTQAAREFISLQPPGLWPEGEDSNFGQIRKVFTDLLQENIDELTTLWNEMFPNTSVAYLALWEEMLGLTIDAAKPTADRRAAINAARRYGGFRRGLIRSIIDQFLEATFGESIALTPEGVPMSVGGVPLYSGAFSLIGLARVYEDVRNFAYEVWIKSTSTPDMATMLKLLQRVTPAGITITVDNTHLDVLDYFRLVRNAQPVWYSRLNGNANDASGYGSNGVVSGAPATLAAPGLLDPDVAGGDGGLVFDGVDDFFTIPVTPQMALTDQFAIEFLLKTATAGKQLIYTNTGSWQLRIRSTGALALENGTITLAESAIPVTDNVAHHVVIKKVGDEAIIKVDGVDLTTLNAPGVFTAPTAIYVGQTSAGATRYTGGMDELAFYNYVLSDEVDSDHNNTRQDIATY